MFRDKPQVVFMSQRGFSHPDRKRFERIVAAHFGDKVTVEFNDAGQPTFLSQEKEHPSPSELDHSSAAPGTQCGLSIEARTSAVSPISECCDWSFCPDQRRT